MWFLLAAASAGVFLHAGIKFPWFVFFQKDSGLRPPEPPWNMRAAMVLVAVLCIGLGVAYEPLYRLLPHPVDYQPYTAFHVVAQLQLLLFSGLAFFVMLTWLRRTLTITLDTDWLYRVLFTRLALDATLLVSGAMASAGRDAARAAKHLERAAHALVGSKGVFGRTWAVGTMALGMMVFLFALLVSYYLS